MACHGRGCGWHPGHCSFCSRHVIRLDLRNARRVMHATPEGTLRYTQAQPPSHRSNYRQTVDGLWMSSVGLGTYLGQPDDATDADYQQAIDQAVALCCNLIDFAVNYSFQRS